MATIEQEINRLKDAENAYFDATSRRLLTGFSSQQNKEFITMHLDQTMGLQNEQTRISQQRENLFLDYLLHNRV